MASSTKAASGALAAILSNCLNPDRFMCAVISTRGEAFRSIRSIITKAERGLKMRIYLSGVMNQEVIEFCARRDAYRLLTYAYPKDCDNYIRFCREEGLKSNIIVDSGAFTAWSKGKSVSLQRLSQFYDD